MRSKSHERTSRNKPFRWIELVPLDGIPIIHRELVVEVVVAFAQCKKRRDKMVAWSMFVIKGRLS